MAGRSPVPGSGQSALQPEPASRLGHSATVPNAADDPWLWYWGYGAEPERYWGGEPTRDAILPVARLESEGETFSIVEARRGGFRFDIFDADRLLEDFDERNEECWGEDGPEFACPQGSKPQLEKALAATFEAWFAEHKPARRWAFEFMRNEETFLSAEDAAEDQSSGMPKGGEL